MASERLDEINSTRARCVELLRKEVGIAFYGGVAPDDFAQKHYSNAVLSDKRAFAKHNYLKILKEYPICVATKGLWHSIGFKFAEYIARSKVYSVRASRL